MHSIFLSPAPCALAEACVSGIGLTLVLGGARSGKSRYAENLARGAGIPVVFIATAEAGDEEMGIKIARHRLERPLDWVTVEEPLAVGQAVARFSGAFVIVDCLTLWASNVLLAGGDTAAAVDSLLVGLAAAGRVVVVSNEVGSGVVPEYRLGREYRDLLGEVNARVAAMAANVVLMVAGLPLTLKTS